MEFLIQCTREVVQQCRWCACWSSEVVVQTCFGLLFVSAEKETELTVVGRTDNPRNPLHCHQDRIRTILAGCFLLKILSKCKVPKYLTFFDLTKFIIMLAFFFHSTYYLSPSSLIQYTTRDGMNEYTPLCIPYYFADIYQSQWVLLKKTLPIFSPLLIIRTQKIGTVSQITSHTELSLKKKYYLFFTSVCTLLNYIPIPRNSDCNSKGNVKVSAAAGNLKQKQEMLGTLIRQGDILTTQSEP